MKKTPVTTPDAELRHKAEARLSRLKREPLETPKTDADLQRLVHELQVHQIELEMQQEELAQARMQLETTLDMYVKLYTLAPVGYFTLTLDGVIRHSNPTGAKLVGMEPNELVGRRFDFFVSIETRATFRSFLNKVFTGRKKDVCRVALQKDWLPTPLWVHIVGVGEPLGRQAEICYMIVSEIAELKTKQLGDFEGK